MTRLHIDRDWCWFIPADPSLVAHLCAQELAQSDSMPPYFPALLEHLQLRKEEAKVQNVTPMLAQTLCYVSLKPISLSPHLPFLLACH
jgi:hypothetical protein